MAIRIRDKKVNSVVDEESEKNNKNSAEVKNFGDRGEFGPLNGNTWKERDILVLTELEKEGINVYDEDRYPGMYLKNNQQTDKKSKALINKLINKGNTNTQSQNNDDNNPKKQDLINWLINK